jgi:hypothetical protein
MGQNAAVTLGARIGVAALLAIAALAGASGGTASSTVTPCSPVNGFAIYANGVGCPTAKKHVRAISARPFRAALVTIRNVPGWLCVARYNRRTKLQVAGSCLKVGTTATGFGWTKGGARVPLPPGAQQPPPPPPPP